MGVSSDRPGQRRARPIGAVLVAMQVSTGAYAGSILSDPLSTRSVLSGHALGPADPDEPNCALPEPGVTLSQAVELALCRNPATRSASAAANQQATQLSIAEATRFPTLSAAGSENWLNESRRVAERSSRRWLRSPLRPEPAGSGSARGKDGRWRGRSWRCRWPSRQRRTPAGHWRASVIRPDSSHRPPCSGPRFSGRARPRRRAPRPRSAAARPSSPAAPGSR